MGPNLDGEEHRYVSDIINICKELKIDVVLPTNDIDIFTLSKANDVFTMSDVKLC